jgi:hypothetical protein
LLLDRHAGTCAVRIVDEGFLFDYRIREHLLVRSSVRIAFSLFPEDKSIYRSLRAPLDHT